MGYTRERTINMSVETTETTELTVDEITSEMEEHLANMGKGDETETETETETDNTEAEATESE